MLIIRLHCRHAGRTVITADDVLLLARRNPGLQKCLQDAIEEEKGKGDR